MGDMHRRFCHISHDIGGCCKVAVACNLLAARDYATPCLGVVRLQSATLAHCRMLGCQAQRR